MAARHRKRSAAAMILAYQCGRCGRWPWFDFGTKLPRSNRKLRI
jgi:hypothetical protein